jgi:hypothetical protein
MNKDTATKLPGETLSPFNVTNASSTEDPTVGSYCTIHDILIKESPCVRIPNANSTSIGITGISLAKNRLSPKDKKINNDCLKQIEVDSVNDLDDIEN